jgi:hypothetical protein
MASIAIDSMTPERRSLTLVSSICAGGSIASSSRWAYDRCSSFDDDRVARGGGYAGEVAESNETSPRLDVFGSRNAVDGDNIH